MTNPAPNHPATRRRHARSTWLAAALAGSVLIVACSSDKKTTSTTAAPATTVAATATTAAGSATTAAGSTAGSTGGAATSTPVGTGGAATTTAASGAAPSGTLKIGMAKGDVQTLDPQRWYSAATWGLANALCTTLIRYADVAGADGAKVVPGLADLPTVSADGLTYTFKLKAAKFANGDPITPDDIKYTFERLMDPKVDTGTGGYFEATLMGAQDYADGKTPDIAGITTTTDSVAFQLTTADGSFENKIALPTTCPVGKDAAKAPSDSDASILQEYGSGPYVIKSFTDEQSMQWVRNPNYDTATLGERGHAETIDFTIGVDPAQAALKIKAGDIDAYTGNFPTADIVSISNDATLKAQQFASARPAVLTLFLNNDVAPFDNPLVRQAVNFALNRTQIQRVWGGPSVGTPTDQILPPAVPNYREYSVYPNAPDLDKAKSLMQQAGITTPVKTQLRARNDDAGFTEVATVVQANLAEIGITVEIVGATGSIDSAAD
ncbi:MAG: ABC transporter substrate-binding protein, partial [Ilumatobacteraceae bacterium]